MHRCGSGRSTSSGNVHVMAESPEAPDPQVSPTFTVDGLASYLYTAARTAGLKAGVVFDRSTMQCGATFTVNSRSGQQQFKVTVEEVQ